jgi:YegS/Rv2252/BmrU family lipid kinase
MTATAQETARIFVVLNPVAGSCSADDVRQALQQHLGEHAYSDVYETTGDEDVAAIVRAQLAHAPAIVVAAGGDGTISEVAEALIGTSVPLGIIPVGTANVFARELGIPLDLDGACALLSNLDSTTSVDAMKVDEQYYVLQIGIGIDSLMIRDTDRQAKRRFGRAAYLWTAFTRLIGYQPVRFTIVADGTRTRPRASQVLIANGGVLGVAPFRWGPHIRPDDGKIDVCIVSARTAIDYLGLLWHTLVGQQRRDRNVRYLAATRSIAISADHPLPIQADGEIIGETPLQIEVVPHALKVIVPAPSATEKQEKQGAGLEDAPPHPWAEPSPEARAAAEPAKQAIKAALQAIKTPEQAEHAAAEAIAAAAGATEKQVREQGGAAPDPAQAIQAAASTPGGEKAPATLVEAARQVAGSDGEMREALEQALQEATNPEQHGQPAPETQEPLDMLRAAILKQMKPYQAIDARLYLAINHLPHTPLTNRLMYFVTTIMNGGFGWVLGLTIAALLGRKGGRQALLQVVPPLWFATMTVEYPIKYYFRRRRPFVDVVQAIAVGRKPGTYSFPSGHSAAAFAGAWLLRRHYPRLAPLWYAIAGLVGFSRIYLGAHYPGDVLSGALAGTALAEATRWVIDQGDDESLSAHQEI